MIDSLRTIADSEYQCEAVLPCDIRRAVDETQQHVTGVVRTITIRNSSTVGRAVDDRARELVFDVARANTDFEAAKKRLVRSEQELGAKVSELNDLNAWLTSNGMAAHVYHDARKS